MTVRDGTVPWIPLSPAACRSTSAALRRFSSILNSCSSAKQLFQIHAYVILSGLNRHSFLTDEIIRFCTSTPPCAKGSVDLINHSRCIVNFYGKVRTALWNNVIKAYATCDSNSQKEGVRVFLDMRRLGVSPNEYTFPYLFKACASFSGLNEGRQIHGGSIKHGFCFNVYVQNTLIHLYGSCRKIMDAYTVFDQMPHRTPVSWNSIMSAAVECSWLYECVEMFDNMKKNGFEPDETTMVIMLSACAELGNLSLGKWIHSQVIEKGMAVGVYLGTALVDMYGKCGNVNYASLVFYSMVHRNVWTWSAMILGFAQHGFARRALELFKEMSNDHLVKPNEVTFLGVLSACSHAGLVEDGRNYFIDMEQVHGIKPMMTHFCAMVDILGRAGRIKEAYKFILDMPIQADAVVWRALLSACNVHDVNDYSGIGEKVRQKLIELEPKRSGNLVMLANNYTEVGVWEKAEHLRREMRDKGLKKKAGESCLEVGGSVFRFLSG